MPRKLTRGHAYERAMRKTNFTHDATALPHNRPGGHRRQTQETQKADNAWRPSQSGHLADTRRSHGRHIWRTRFGGRRKADTADKVGRRGQSAIKADTRRTQGAQWRTHGGDMADKLRGRGQSISRPAFFLLRETFWIFHIERPDLAIQTLLEKSFGTMKSRVCPLVCIQVESIFHYFVSLTRKQAVQKTTASTS